MIMTATKHAPAACPVAALRQRIELEAYVALIDQRLRGHDLPAIGNVARQLTAQLHQSCAASLTDLRKDGARVAITLTLCTVTVQGDDIADLTVLRNWQSAARDKINALRMDQTRRAGL